jgi:hypothetical protein
MHISNAWTRFRTLEVIEHALKPFDIKGSDFQVIQLGSTESIKSILLNSNWKCLLLCQFMRCKRTSKQWITRYKTSLIEQFSFICILYKEKHLLCRIFIQNF